MKQVITALLATLFIASLEHKFPLWATIIIAAIYILLHWLFSSKTYKEQLAKTRAKRELDRKNKISESAIKKFIDANEQNLKNSN